MELRDAMHSRDPRSSLPRLRWITFEMNRRGFAVNHKRVLRVMRADNLLCLRHKSLWSRRISRHQPAGVPNPGPRSHKGGESVGGPNYLHRRETSSLCLAVVLDAYFGACDGWALGRTWKRTAWRHWHGVRQRRPATGLVHHSDRGVRTPSHNNGFTERLRPDQQSRKGQSVYDNAAAVVRKKREVRRGLPQRSTANWTMPMHRSASFGNASQPNQRLHSALG